MLVQVDLQNANRFLTCWVLAKNLKVGNFITLKNHAEPKLLWKVLRIGDPKLESSIYRGWNNNI